MKFDPKEIAKETMELLKNKPLNLDEACEVIAKKHDLRVYDVRIVTIVHNPTLYHNWCPNRRLYGRVGEGSSIGRSRNHS